jgi:endo-1,4-beta-xylanase
VLKRTATGYRLEAAIGLSPAGVVGAHVAFDLRVADAHRPLETLSWNDRTNGQDTDTTQAGQLTLLDAVRRVDAPRATPVVDGVAEKAWNKATAITTGIQVSGTGGATATAKVLWDAGHLYLFVKVTDPTLDESSPNPWEQDSIEVFLDPDNGKTAGFDDDDGQYRISFTNRQGISGNFDAYVIADNLTSAAKVVTGGYVIEAAIALTTLAPCEGDLLGLDLQVNDATAGARTAAHTWNDPTGISYLNTSRWGVVRLGPR